MWVGEGGMCGYGGAWELPHAFLCARACEGAVIVRSSVKFVIAVVIQSPYLLCIMG